MSVKPLPKWIMQRYALLWENFKTKEFTYKESSRILNEKDERVIGVVLFYLKKYGWLTVRSHPLNSRIRTYQLKSWEVALKEMLTPA